MRLYLSLILLICLTKGFSQKQLRLQHFSTEEGLSHSTITDIFQDRSGFLWISTYNGLNRFDGTTFRTYFTIEGAKNSIASPETYKIFEDTKGNLWIGTTAGISLYNREYDNFKNYTFQTGTHSMYPVRSIVNLNNPDELLLGTFSGLFLFNTQKTEFTFCNLDNPENESNYSIIAMHKDSNGRIWAVLEKGGVWVVEKKDNQIVRNREIERQISLINNKNVLSVTEDKNSTIWMGTTDGFLYKYNLENNQLKYYIVPTKPFTEITSIIEKEPNKIWLAVNKKGILIFDTQTKDFSELSYQMQPGNKMLYALYKDKHNNVWLGSMNSGISLYDELDKRFSFFATTDDIGIPVENNSILSICYDPDGNIWLGTDGGGLIKYNKNNKTPNVFNKPNAPGLPYKTVLSILAASNGIIYMGTYLDGLYEYDPYSNTCKNYLHNASDINGITDNTIWNIFEDNAHQIWIATNTGGLVKFNPATKSFSSYKINSKKTGTISSNSVRAICQDDKGILWIGTADGLNRLDVQTNVFTNYHYQPNNENSLSNNCITSLLIGSSNRLFIGTLRGGLNIYHYNDDKFYRYSEKSGLISNTVYALQEDEQGNIWISTDKGISKFNPESQSFNNYNSKNGLFSSRFNLGATFKNSKGELLFGSLNGVCRFVPYYVKQNKNIPPVYITDIKVYNKSLNPEGIDTIVRSFSEIDTLRLNHFQNFISFKFAALNFSHAFNNQYAYKLEPVEKDWIQAGNTQSASYTNLKPGTYCFKVKGSNNDGIWNPTERSITIIIDPPFWKTKWFSGIVIIILLSGLYWWYKRNEQQKIKLEELVKQRTYELEETNKKIIETEKSNALLQQQQLNSALQLKSKELSRTVLIIMQKNKLLEELKNKLKEAIRNPQSVNIDYFRDVLRTINLNFSTTKEWKEFDAYFDEVHHSFVKTLKQQYPGLSNNDLRLCTLFRINVPAREISELLNVSPESLKKSRYRLRKKLNLSPDVDLTEYLSQL